MSASIADAKTDHLQESAAEMTEEEREAAAARERFLAEFQGDSMFLDELAGDGGAGAAAGRAARDANGGESGGLISVGGSDVEEGSVDIDEANLRAGGRRGKSKVGAEDGQDEENVALGPPGSVPLRQVRKQQADAAGGAGIEELGDAWADMGFERPQGAQEEPAAGDGAVAAAQDEEVDAFAAFEDLDPFAGFADLAIEDARAAADGDVLTAGASVQPAQRDASVPTSSADASTGGAQPDGTAAAAQSAAGSGRRASPEPSALPQDGSVGQGSGAEPPYVMPQPPQAPQAQRQPAAQYQQQQQPQAAEPTDPSIVPGFREGVQAMFAGSWQAASAYFGQAFEACRNANTPRLRSVIAQYAAAVGILEAYAAVDERGAARLSRYAAGLPLLLIDHLSILVNDAVGRNVRAGNFEWCRQALNELGHHFMAIGQPEYAHNVGVRLQQIAGVGNATVGDQESTHGLVTRVNEAVSMQEIATAVASVKAGMM